MSKEKSCIRVAEFVIVEPEEGYTRTDAAPNWDLRRNLSDSRLNQFRDFWNDLEVQTGK